jgi:hypothetical protein
LEALARPRSAAQLRFRLWATYLAALVVLVMPTLLAVLARSAELMVSSLTLAFVGAWYIKQEGLSSLIPKVWARATDEEIVQLAEMAQLYPQVNALVHRVKGMNRPFRHLDWLQARAIELELGRAQTRRRALEALKALEAHAPLPPSI